MNQITLSTPNQNSDGFAESQNIKQCKRTATSLHKNSDISSSHQISNSHLYQNPLQPPPSTSPSTYSYPNTTTMKFSLATTISILFAGQALGDMGVCSAVDNNCIISTGPYTARIVKPCEKKFPCSRDGPCFYIGGNATAKCSKL